MSRRGSQRLARAGVGDFVPFVEDWSSDEEDVVDYTNIVGGEEGWQDDQSDVDDEDPGQPRRRINGVPGQAVPTENDEIEVEDDEEETDRPPRRGRRLLHRDKQINCLREALNPANYNMMTLPTRAEEKVPMQEGLQGNYLHVYFIFYCIFYSIVYSIVYSMVYIL